MGKGHDEMLKKYIFHVDVEDVGVDADDSINVKELIEPNG